jgi:Phage gp6-like head-tail connector protein
MSFPGYPDSFDPGWWRTYIQVPPIADPVTLADAKQFARIEFSDDDSLVTGLITGAREYIETAQARALMTQVITIYFMGFPWTGGYYNRMIRSMGPNPWWLPTAQGIIMLPRPPLQMILSVGYIDPSLGTQNYVLPSNYIFSNNSTPGRIMPTYGAVWPLARPQIDAVQITYVAGYGSTTFGSAQTQTLAMQGFPSSGTFTLTFNGDTTTALNYNCLASDIQAALQALGNVGAGNVTCAGGPILVAPVVVTWAGTMATGYQPLITATSTFIGTAQPAVLTTIAQLFPSVTQIALKQIVADSYENREASLDYNLSVTPTSSRMLQVERWGDYV